MTREDITRLLDQADRAALHALPPEYYLPSSIRRLTVRATVIRALLALSDVAPDKHAAAWLLECAGEVEQ